MLSKLHHSRVARGAAALAVASAGVVGMISGAPIAGADPKWPTALIGHGSDTTQDVMSALAGEESGTFYIPVSSSVGSGSQVLSSWDAVGSTCITPKAGGATINRGNGSSNGRRILSRAIDGGLWGNASCGPAAGRPTAGLVDFARSSAGPSSIGTALTYIPFGRDALSFAYVANGVAPVTQLSFAEVTQIMQTDGGLVVDGVRIFGCGIQTGSGTFQSWNTALGMTTDNEAIGTADCNAAGNGQRLQESDGNGLKAKSDAIPNAQVIVGFSAANYIAQNNGAVTSQLPSPAGTVRLGEIDALGVPYVGNPGSQLTPAATFYGSTTFGRDVYNVVSTTRLAPPESSNAALKTMFMGPSSAVCSATNLIQTFGFLGLGGACGSTTLQGPLVAN